MKQLEPICIEPELWNEYLTEYSLKFLLSSLEEEIIVLFKQYNLLKMEISDSSLVFIFDFHNELIVISNNKGTWKFNNFPGKTTKSADAAIQILEWFGEWLYESAPMQDTRKVLIKSRLYLINFKK